MDELLNSISESVRAGYAYPSFMSSLCLPDICGYLDSPTTGSKQRYIDWFNKYMLSYRGIMDGEEAYSLRCIVLHNGELATTQYKFGSPKSGIILDQFILTSNGSHLLRLQNNYVNGIEQPNLVIINTNAYCTDLINAVKKWQSDSGKSLGEYNDIFKIKNGPMDIMDGAISIS